MFSSIFNKNRLHNPTLSKYCTQYTNESIRKMVQKYDEEQKDKLKSLLITTASKDQDTNSNIFFIQFFCFLSTSTFIYYLLNKKQ